VKIEGKKKRAEGRRVSVLLSVYMFFLRKEKKAVERMCKKHNNKLIITVIKQFLSKLIVILTYFFHSYKH
jgi:hypothetical protein